MNFNVNYITMILVHAKFPIRGRIVRDSVNYTSSWTYCSSKSSSYIRFMTYLALSITQVNRMYRSRRVLAIGGKHCNNGWTGSVFIHFYVL